MYLSTRLYFVLPARPALLVVAMSFYPEWALLKWVLNVAQSLANFAFSRHLEHAWLSWLVSLIILNAMRIMHLSAISSPPDLAQARPSSIWSVSLTKGVPHDHWYCMRLVFASIIYGLI